MHEITQCLASRDRLIEKIVDAEIEKDEAVTELSQLIGYNLEVPSMEAKDLDI